MTVMMMMLMSMLAVEFAAALVTAMHPVTVLAMTSYPDKLVAGIPIGGTFVIRLVAYFDGNGNRAGIRTNQHSHRQKRGQYSCNFLLHGIMINTDQASAKAG